MTQKEKVAHLCRRLAFGINLEERARYEAMPLNNVIDDLLDFSRTDTKFPVHPYEFCWDAKGNFQNNPSRTSSWWMTRMVVTDRPVRDKLLLFLHDHFAVSGAKVGSGVLMLGYLQTLEHNIGSRFADLLKAISTNPAMMIWLDLPTNIAGTPNENYARELMELFTLGVDDGYTELDVRAAARALTGWNLRVITNEEPDPKKRLNLLLDYARQGKPVVGAAFAESFHDVGPETILGVKGTFDLDSLCDLLAQQRGVAEYISHKLWEFYAYPNPDPKVIKVVADSFQKNEGRLDRVIRTIVSMNEFWSPEAVRSIIKSPVDFLVGVARQVVDTTKFMSLRPKDTDLSVSAPAQMQQVGNALVYLSNRQGLFPLYPPNVAGWDWGDGWISSASMVERMNAANNFTGTGRGRSLAETVVRVAGERNEKSLDALVDIVAEVLDAPIDANSKKILMEAAQSSGLDKSLGNLNQASVALRPVLRLVFAMPAFQTI
ncbi:MAG TPA: DUF1800 domain-containing protein [Fimbriimonadaceae bacterium]|nr:DUF1800 domain-containing protein [Fimbriimonadaceae bacterium]